jgi:hypothetical protein
MTTDELRKPFFVLAIVLLVLALLLEMGSNLLIGRSDGLPNAAAEGFGVSSLAVLDALLILSVALMGATLFAHKPSLGRLQGVITLLVSLAVLMGSIGLIVTAIGLLTLMVGLLLAPIFGTAAYFTLFGDFDRVAAASILGLVMSLKLGFAVSLLLAHQLFLENKTLVLLIATSLLAVVVVGFLHALVPNPLVSITDAIAAIVVNVLALVWALIVVVGSVLSIRKAARL